ncbi:putative transglutaminase protein [Desulforapulum autotrophicum HRM2]|uniref:Transglutaminase protein n=1 Tax=Desulforapulum autotrophicum (strain ATCC 43914 / DSM 3382 / VKM B-1955 / HRM2) TaxID=177437 RepID=C0Q903_DESAH|nr:transglutaminase family protein [Desulforapulum autotrophicum]ACN14493.1 putative transglutaminase protein [Desulforapulum autotrophicum HRM2]
MQYNISHITRYHHGDVASLSHNELFLTPRQTPTQNCVKNTITLSPEPSTFSQRMDFFGNTVTTTTIQRPHRTLEITAGSQVILTPANPIPPEQTPAWDQVKKMVWQHATPETMEAFQFVFASSMIPVGEKFAAWARDLFQPGEPILKAALALTERVFTQFKYDPGATTTTTAVDTSFEMKRGVCQDFAHIEIACLRSLGLCARYVSGYLHTLPPPGKEKLVGADASHAWLSIYIPGMGWVDLDPTNNVIPTDQHLTLAWGRDYSDVTPVKGTVLGGGTHQLSVSVDVRPGT